MKKAPTVLEPKIRKLEDGEVLRFSLHKDGIIVIKDEKEEAVENTIVALGTAIGTFVAHNDDLNVKDCLVDLVRSYKFGYDKSQHLSHSSITNVKIDDETGEVKEVRHQEKGTIKKQINLEEYK